MKLKLHTERQKLGERYGAGDGRREKEEGPPGNGDWTQWQRSPNSASLQLINCAGTEQLCDNIYTQSPEIQHDRKVARWISKHYEYQRKNQTTKLDRNHKINHLLHVCEINDVAST